VRDWQEGCERCKQILRYGGMGHTMSIHSTNEQVILEFGLKKPAFRIVVNSPTTHGSIGLTTGLDPAMTLGCGGFGGNITSDNISPRHLLNIKRLAYEIAPVSSRFERGSAAAASPQRVAKGISSEALSGRIDDFLRARGYEGLAANRSTTATSTSASAGTAPIGVPDASPLTFVCEDDVRAAIRAGRKLVLAERAIVTPSARELGEQHHVFDPPRQ
jgi:acetaldehyde dehydrogenase (acetylating)